MGSQNILEQACLELAVLVISSCRYFFVYLCPYVMYGIYRTFGGFIISVFVVSLVPLSAV